MRDDANLLKFLIADHDCEGARLRGINFKNVSLARQYAKKNQLFPNRNRPLELAIAHANDRHDFLDNINFDRRPGLGVLGIRRRVDVPRRLSPAAHASFHLARLVRPAYVPCR